MRTPDGIELHVRTWHPPDDTRVAGSLLLIHGLGEHGARYAQVAEHLAGLGLVVRTYDQRGFGASGGARGTIPADHTLLDDAKRVYDAFAAERLAGGDDAAPFLLGHSLGGCVAARAATGGWIAPRGLILSSPALVPRMSIVERVAAEVGLRLFPRLRAPHRLRLHLLTHDPAMPARIRADALMHDRITPRLAMFMIRQGARAIGDAGRLTVPTLVLAAGSDHMVDVRGAEAFAAGLPAGVGTLRVYPELYHEIFNEPSALRGPVFADLAAWILERVR